MSGADLLEACLAGADLSGAVLRRTNLMEADLSDTNFSGADLSGADLSRTNLTGAVLQGADLSGACLRGSYVDETDFEGVRSDRSTEWPAGFEPRPAVRAGASTSELLVQVQNGHDQRHLGNVNNAQRILDGVWQQVEHGPQRFVRAVCALELAGLENDPAVALPWGLRALEEADGLTDADVAVGGLPSVQVLFPGLRLALPC